MDDADSTKRWVARYRELGLCPLPSRGDAKAPQLSAYRGAYNLEAVPEWVYDQWFAPNIQLVTGVLSPTPIKIIVVDCDGERAIATWQKMCAFHQWLSSPSWSVRTGGGGLHFYFRVPSGTQSVRTGMIWGLWDTWGASGTGGWSTHEEIKILGDKSLVVAPPSLHPRSGKHYEYVGLDSPERVELPEVAPTWLLESPRLSTLSSKEPVTASVGTASVIASAGRSIKYERNSVLRSIPDKVSLVKSWGLDFVTLETSTGWLPVFVPGRELRGRSRTPSGSFHVESGVLNDHSTGVTMSLLDIGVALGVFNSWLEALDWCGEHFVVSMK